MTNVTHCTTGKVADEGSIGINLYTAAVSGKNPNPERTLQLKLVYTIRSLAQHFRKSSKFC